MENLKDIKEVRNMERKEISPFSHRARKLISKAFKEGVDPDVIKAEMQIAIGFVQKRGRNRVTRGDLEGLVVEIESERLQSRLAWSNSGGILPWM